MNGMIILFREWMGSGVPSGLQNQYEELGASWVGSIPTHSRQNDLNSQPVKIWIFSNSTGWLFYIEKERVLQMKEYNFESKIYASEVGKGGAYIIFPYDVREEFNKGRVKVHATFDGVDYQGSIVNMGVKNEDGSICYILGIRKDIRKQLNKDIGDSVVVTVREID